MRGSRALTVFLSVLIIIMMASAASAAIKISKIQYDSPGSDDGSNASLNNEYVVIENTGSSVRRLEGYVLRDEAGHVYEFGTFRLAAGKSVTVHTGKGSNDRNDVYWGSGWYIWNNDGDTATLRNSAGHTVDSCTYAGGGTFVNC
jgi:hypothetical protein